MYVCLFVDGSLVGAWMCVMSGPLFVWDPGGGLVRRCWQRVANH